MFGKLGMLIIIKCRIPWAQGTQIENEGYHKFLLKLKSIGLHRGFLDNVLELLSICKHHKREDGKEQLEGVSEFNQEL